MKKLFLMLFACMCVSMVSANKLDDEREFFAYYDDATESNMIVPIITIHDTLIYIITDPHYNIVTMHAHWNGNNLINENAWYHCFHYHGDVFYIPNRDDSKNNEKAEVIKNKCKAIITETCLDMSIDDIVMTANGAFYEHLCKTAPYGYYDYEWDTNSCDGVDITFKYTNTNKKTIKYVDFWYAVYNDVNDRCPVTLGSSHGKCVGPVPEGETGEWSWDALGYTTGDASRLKITKIQITYMDGTKVVLIKNMKRL